MIAAGVVAMVLVASVFSNRPLARIGDISLRPDWMAAALAVSWAAYAGLRRHPLPPAPVLAALGGFVGVQVLSSAVNAAAWPGGLKFSLLYVLALGYVVAVCAATTRAAAAGRVLTLLVGLGLIEALFGVISVLLRNLGDLYIGGLTQDLSGVVAARGSMTERNLFSSLLLVPFAVALWRWSAHPRASWPLAAAVTGMTAGLVFGLTRAVWVGVAGILAVWCWRQRPGWRKPLAVAVTAVIATLVLTASELLAVDRGDRQLGLYNRLFRYFAEGADSPVVTRMEEARTSVAGWRGAAWLGKGAGSVTQLEQIIGGARRTGKRGHSWVGNMVLMILHDAGLLGLLAFSGIVVAVAWDCWRTTRQGRDRPLGAEREAMAVGLAAVLLAWQTTNGLWLMYGYAFAGLLLSANALARRPPP